MSKYIKVEVTSENLEELKPYMDEKEYTTLCQLLPAIDEGGWFFEFQNYDYESEYISSLSITVFKDTRSVSGYVLITNNANDGDEYFTDQYIGKEKWSTIIK